MTKAAERQKRGGLAIGHGPPTLQTEADAFRPTEKQLRCAAIALQEPQLSFDWARLAERSKTAPSTIDRWRVDPGFRTWWNETLKTGARAEVGPALLQLLAVIKDGQASNADKTKAVAEFCRLVSEHGQPGGSGIVGLLERLWGMELHGSTARVVTDGSTLAAEISPASPGSDNGDYVSPEECVTAQPPAGAVQLPPSAKPGPNRSTPTGKPQHLRRAADRYPGDRITRPGVLGLPQRRSRNAAPLLASIDPPEEYTVERKGQGGSEITPAPRQVQRAPYTHGAGNRPSPQSDLDRALRERGED